MSEWRSSRARQVLASLLRIPNFVFSFHDSEEIGPRMLAGIGKRTGLKAEN